MMTRRELFDTWVESWISSFRSIDLNYGVLHGRSLEEAITTRRDCIHERYRIYASADGESRNGFDRAFRFNGVCELLIHRIGASRANWARTRRTLLEQDSISSEEAEVLRKIPIMISIVADMTLQITVLNDIIVRHIRRIITPLGCPLPCHSSITDITLDNIGECLAMLYHILSPIRTVLTDIESILENRPISMATIVIDLTLSEDSDASDDSDDSEDV